MSSPHPEDLAPAEMPQPMKVFPKIKAWDASVRKIIDKFGQGRLHGALLHTARRVTELYDRGMYAMNIGHIPLRPKNWLYGLFTNGTQTLTMSSSVRNGLHNVGTHFASVAESRYCFGSLTWWLFRRRAKLMMRTTPEELANHIGKALQAFYRCHVPLEALAYLCLQTRLFKGCPELYVLIHEDGIFEVMGRFSNGSGDYASFFAEMDPSQLLAENLART